MTFESCPGTGNSTRTGILWKMKVNLKKSSVDQFLQVKTKNKPNFLPFSRFTCFLNGIFAGLWVNFLVLLSHIPYKNSEELPLACLYLNFHLVMIIHTYFCTKDYDYVKCFFPLIRFISDKYRVSQNISYYQKWGTLHC